jgi:hypothetical protein
VVDLTKCPTHTSFYGVDDACAIEAHDVIDQEGGCGVLGCMSKTRPLYEHQKAERPGTVSRQEVMCKRRDLTWSWKRFPVRPRAQVHEARSATGAAPSKN